MKRSRAVCGDDVEQHRQVRDEPVGGPAGDAGDLGGREVAAGALVGDGGVDVAVGDDDGAALQRGPDHRVDVLGAVGGVEQRLGAVREPGGGDVEQDRAQPLADRGGARLAGDDDLVALGSDPLGERLDLGGLAGAVAALDGDEEAGGGGRGGRVAAAQRLAQVAPQRYAAAVVDLAEHERGDRQQQRADQHQGVRGAAVGEGEVAVARRGAGRSRRPAAGRRRRRRRGRRADDGVQVARWCGPGVPPRPPGR